MDPNARNIFALLCLLGIVAVGVAAMLEYRRTLRGESVITPVQFRLRMVSAVIWVIVLGSISFAILELWPAPNNRIQAQKFISVISGVFLLLIIAIILMGYDLWLFSLQRRRKQAEFNRELAAMAQAEIQRVQGRGGTSELQPPPSVSNSLAAPPDSAPKNGLHQ